MTMVLCFCLKSPNFVQLYTEVFLEEMITLLDYVTPQRGAQVLGVSSKELNEILR